MRPADVLSIARQGWETPVPVIMGSRCPLSSRWTSSQLLAPAFSHVIRLPAKGPLLSLLCAMMQGCSRVSVTDVLKSVA